MNPVTNASGSDAEELVYAAAILILSHDLYPRKLEVVPSTKSSATMPGVSAIVCLGL